VNRPIYDTTITNLNRLLNANNYSKGGWVLHMLRGLMGDDKFFAGIREYYKTYRNRNALTEDFQAIMEKHARQDLDWFFRQWIYEAGYPKLEVSWRWDDQNKEVKLLLSQKQDGFFFRLPMELEIRDGNVKKREKVVLEKKDQVFSFRITSKPTSVVVDPDDWVLKEIALEAK
jgi:aminopeptidase N